MRVNNLYFSKFIKKSLKSHARPFSRRKFGIHARDPLAVPYSVPIHSIFFGKTTINKRIYSIRNTRVGSFRWPLWSLHPEKLFSSLYSSALWCIFDTKNAIKIYVRRIQSGRFNDDFLTFELIFHDFCIKMCYFADFSHDSYQTSVYISSVIRFESKCHFSILKIGTARTNTKICRTYFPTNTILNNAPYTDFLMILPGLCMNIRRVMS